MMYGLSMFALQLRLLLTRDARPTRIELPVYEQRPSRTPAAQKEVAEAERHPAPDLSFAILRPFQGSYPLLTNLDVPVVEEVTGSSSDMA